jgi:hypothetical protein
MADPIAPRAVLPPNTGTVGDVTTMVRALMNDMVHQQFTDFTILPYLRIAYEDLKSDLMEYNIPFTNATSNAILIPAGVTTIGDDTPPLLPPGLVEIFSISERTAGTNNDFVLMERRQFLPMTEQLTSHLRYWAWWGHGIRFIGATAPVEVKLNFILSGSNFAEIVDENTIFRVDVVKAYLAYRTAGHCSMFIGENETRAATLYGFADKELDKLLSISIKSQQAIKTRRRPFRASFKTHGI